MPKTTAKPTKYRILQKVGDGTYKIVADAVEANGGARAAFLKGVKEAGEFVAVPVSNWTEETVSIEQPPPKLVLAGQPAVQSTVDDQLAASLDEVDEQVAAVHEMTKQQGVPTSPSQAVKAPPEPERHSIRA